MIDGGFGAHLGDWNAVVNEPRNKWVTGEWDSAKAVVFARLRRIAERFLDGGMQKDVEGSCGTEKKVCSHVEVVGD